MLVFGLNVIPPSQLAVEVLNFGFHWNRGSKQKDRRAGNMSRGEGNMCGLSRVDANFSLFEPVLEER